MVAAGNCSAQVFFSLREDSAIPPTIRPDANSVCCRQKKKILPPVTMFGMPLFPTTTAAAGATTTTTAQQSKRVLRKYYTTSNTLLSSSSISLPCLFSVLALLGLVLFTLQFESVRRDAQQQQSPQTFQKLLGSSFSTKEGVVFPLKPQRTVLEETELHHMMPPLPPRGILLLFHGCRRAGQDWFLLPEDRIVTMEALQRGLIVVSITSQDRVTGCWGQKDINRLVGKNVVDLFLTQLQQQYPSSFATTTTAAAATDLPRIAMGASSGGTFLFRVYRQFKFQSMASYISPQGYKPQQQIPHPDDNNNNNNTTTTTDSRIPTVFVHMTRDKATAAAVAENARAMDRVPHLVLGVEPHPLTPQLCRERIPELATSSSRRQKDDFCTMFLDNVASQHPNLLEPKSYHVLVPYQTANWKTLFRKSGLDDKTNTKKTTATASEKTTTGTAMSGHSYQWAALEQEITVAYAHHDMTCEHHQQVLDFLMQHAGMGKP